MIQTANLGYPRIGLKRELKSALENFWKGEISQESLIETSTNIQISNWKKQSESQLDFIPSNDFSFYDHVLDTAIMVGAIPERFMIHELDDDLLRYFAVARGYQSDRAGIIPALEMTKWFNTNYHYLVPEIFPQTLFNLNSSKLLNSYKLASKNGFKTRPVVLGPISFLLLSKTNHPAFNPLDKLGDLLLIYENLFLQCDQAGIEWLQFDEPFLGCDLTPRQKDAYQELFHFLNGLSSRPKLMLTTYFADITENFDVIQQSSCEGLHIDILNTGDVFGLLENLHQTLFLSLGTIDGRNVWCSDLIEITDLVKRVVSGCPDSQIIIAPSCSMMHAPLDVDLESNIHNEIKPWLAFANQKLAELHAIKESINNNQLHNLFLQNREILKSRETYQSVILEKNFDADRLQNEDQEFFQRSNSFSIRKKVQKNKLNLPVLPTTTIGSFPQTREVRAARSRFNKKELSQSDYEGFIKNQIEKTIRLQEDIGLDVLVHGEFERNDMVQYFAEKMDGFLFTQHGWVQSYGSRYVRPPIIYTQVSRPEKMTVEWTKYAQSLTEKPVKGMLTGPVTILQWSFVRDDQPRSQTCREIALAIRQEVEDLEKNGTGIIQIDEPALREGLPLQKSGWKEYLSWAVDCFKISSSGVKDETQIHTHMCYAEFDDIIDSILKMDADVISLEASRSGMQLLNVFKEFNYLNDIGPGVYDIHSPNIPSVLHLKDLIEKALEVIPLENLWINPDCGLKTRNWEEVIPSLKAMVEATMMVRGKRVN